MDTNKQKGSQHNAAQAVLWNELCEHAEATASKLMKVRELPDPLIAYRLESVFEAHARSGHWEELLTKYGIEEVQDEWVAAAELRMMDV